MKPGRLLCAFRLTAMALLAVLLAGCGQEQLVSRESYVFGTRVEVLVWGESAEKANAGIDSVLGEFDRMHRNFHAWEPSEVTQLNAAIAVGKPQRVSPELAGYIMDARSLSEKSDGLFDPGIGELIRLWGFHNDSFAAQLPNADALRLAQDSRASIRDISISGDCSASANIVKTAEPCMVRSSKRDVALDFGGYLKGIALDRAAANLKGQGINNALINIGGNIMALGRKGDQPWRVGIQHPRDTSPMATLDLYDGEATGTSGDYQRYFEVDGKRYCHLIDPRSGMPSTASQAVTVLIPPGSQAGMLSDASSKPLFLAGADWPILAQKLGITQALRIDDRGKMQISAALNQRLHLETSDLRVDIIP